MKKKMILFFIIFILCGCNNKNDGFTDIEHYDIRKYKFINSYTFYSDKGVETYVVADMSPEKAEGRDNGIFYQVDLNDYILVDTISVMDNYDDLKIEKNDHTYFYSDVKKGEKNLFILRNLGDLFVEYKLDKEKFEIIDLKKKFDTSEISSDPLLHYVRFSTIVKVDSDNIYCNVSIDNEKVKYYLVKCSLSTYKCQFDE